jgi:hypothetical protein
MNNITKGDIVKCLSAANSWPAPDMRTMVGCHAKVTKVYHGTGYTELRLDFLDKTALKYDGIDADNPGVLQAVRLSTGPPFRRAVTGCSWNAVDFELVERGI